MKEVPLWKRWLVTAAGCYVIGIGIGLTHLAGFGTDPFTVLLVGLVNQFGTTIGIVNIAFSTFMILFAFFVDRRMVSWITIIGLLSTSLGIDSISWLKITAASMVLRILILILGILLYAFGCSVSILPGAGYDGYSAYLLSVVRLTKKPYRIVRWCTEGVFLLVGGLLGGRIGFGTLASFTVTGPLVEWFLGKLRSLTGWHYLAGGEEK